MPIDAYLALLRTAPLDPPGPRDLAQAARAAGFPTDGLVFEALAAKAEGVELPDLPQEDTQLRAWRQYVAGGTRHLFIRLADPAVEDPARTGRLLEALRLLGHQAEALDPRRLEAGSALAGRILALLEVPPPCEAVLLSYTGTVAQDLAAARHHFTVVYGNPANPAEGFYARYVHRQPRNAPARLPGRRPLFSIVIPTRNNPVCLEQTLRTCLEQPFEDFEIVIGDNSDPRNRETQNLVRRLDSERLHYFRADRINKLNDSFEFAHARARGEYVLGLGSDDGLLHHGLTALARVLEQADQPVDALRFDFMYYGWPNAQPRRFQNFIRIPPSIVKQPGGPRLTWVDSRETLERFARYQMPFYDIPNGYGYSILSRRLLDRILEATGRYFPGNSQDIYTGVYTLCLTERFARLDFPITAFAVSGASVGSRMTYRGPERNLVRHDMDGPFLPAGPIGLANLDTEGRDSYYDRCTPMEAYGPARLETCGYTSDEIVNAQAIIDAVNRKLLPRDYMQVINWRRYFELCSNYLYQGDPKLAKKTEEMRLRVARRQDPALEAWFLREFLQNPDFRGNPAPPVQEHFTFGLLPNGVLYLDGQDFGVSNVFDAVQLFRRISHL